MEKELKSLKKAAEALLAEMRDFQASVNLLDTQLLNQIAPLPTTKRSKRKGLKKEEAEKILEGKFQATCSSDEPSGAYQTSLPLSRRCNTAGESSHDSLWVWSLPEALKPLEPPVRVSLPPPPSGLVRQPDVLSVCCVSSPCSSRSKSGCSACVSPVPALQEEHDDSAHTPRCAPDAADSTKVCPPT